MAKDDVLKVMTYVMDADVPLLFGKRNLSCGDKSWTQIKRCWKTNFENTQMEFRLIKTVGNYYAAILELKEEGQSVFFMEDQEEKLTTFEVVKQFHEVDNHKIQKQLLTA